MTAESKPKVTENIIGDPELIALCAFCDYLTPLDQDARERVLRWAQARFIEDPEPDAG